MAANQNNYYNNPRNMNDNNLQRNMNHRADDELIYVTPRRIHNMVALYQFDQFAAIMQQHNLFENLQQNGGQLLMTNVEYLRQIYLRYLCVTGDGIRFFATLRHYYNECISWGGGEGGEVGENGYNEAFIRFLNRTDVPGFEDTTIMDMFIVWIDDYNGVTHLHNMGALSHINAGNIDVIIHCLDWQNPFRGIIDIPGIPQFNRDEFMEHHDVALQIINNINAMNYNNIRFVRHIRHFQNNARALFDILQNNDDNAQLNHLLNRIMNYPFYENRAIE